jgi:hypothetical protein
MATGYLQNLLGDDYEDERRSALNMGLLSAGLQGLAASGPSLMPVSAGQVLGQAGMAGLQGYQDQLANAERGALQGMELDTMREQQESQAAFKAALPQVFQNGKINYEAAQQLALAYPEKMGQVMSALKSTQRPQVKLDTSFREVFDEQGRKVTALVNNRNGEVIRYVGAPAPEDETEWQIDTKTGMAFDKSNPSNAIRLPGFDGQSNLNIPDNATPAEVSQIYKDKARSLSATDPVEAKRYYDLAEQVDPQPKAKPPTDSQLKASGFYDRMSQSNQILIPLEDEGEYPMYGAAIAGIAGETARRFSMSPQEQKYKQAADDWIRAKLRQESGAVISADEMRDEYNTYFPQPGDSPEVIEQKRKARETATESMAKAGGPAVNRSSSSNQSLIDAARAERERRENERGQ